MSKLVYAGGAAVALSTALLASAAPTLAIANSDCATGATALGDGVCEITFTSGTTQWTAPSGMTKLEALLVGAGAGGWQNGSNVAYGGGAGEVRLATDLAQDIPAGTVVEVVVGAGGASGQDHGTITDRRTSLSWGDGNDEIANGGDGGDGGGGTSGAGFTGPIYGYRDGGSADLYVGGGGGAGASPPSQSANGGAGVIVSSLPDAATSLFSTVSTCYGGGGGTAGYVQDTGFSPVFALISSTPVCGGGAATLTGNAQGFGAVSWSPVRANSGSGGAAYFNINMNTAVSEAQNGSAGFVALRYTAAAPLPNTGQNTDLMLNLSGLATVGILAGAAVVLVGRRKAS